MMTMTETLDERDAAILAERAALLANIKGPVAGDYVDFADGVTRRVSHVWDWPATDDEPRIWSIQTSDGGFWYLGRGFVSFSGSLYVGVPGETLTDTGERRDGRAWFFHHDFATAHNGVDVTLPFRVWKCAEQSKPY